MKAIIVILVLWLTVIGCGGGGDAAPSPHVAEQTDYFDGVTYHRYFRHSGGLIGYATSSDGIRFDRRPDPLMPGIFPVLVQADALYLIVKQGADYNLYDVSVPTAPAFVRTILRGDYCNMAVAVVDGVWHALIEGHDDDYFFLMYSVADPDGVFRSFLPVRGDAGNPTLAYIPERNAILALYGADYKATGVWRVRAAVMPLGDSWEDRGVFLAVPGVHMADPDLGLGVESFPLIITMGHGQNAVSTYLFSGSKLGLFDAIMAGHVEMEDIGVTMEPY